MGREWYKTKEERNNKLNEQISDLTGKISSLQMEGIEIDKKEEEE